MIEPEAIETAKVLFRTKWVALTMLPEEAIDIDIFREDGDWWLVRTAVQEWHGRISEVEYPATWWDAFKERWLPFLHVTRKRFALDVVYPEFRPPKILGRAIPVLVEGGWPRGVHGSPYRRDPDDDEED